MPEFPITTTRTEEREFSLSRINVFLGANGTGKSQLLQELKGGSGTFFPNFAPVYIEGGRAVQMYDSLELTAQNFKNFRNSEQILSGFRGGRANTLTSRLFHGLKALEQLGIDAKIAHSDAVVLRETGGGESAPPKLPDDPMARVFETFNDIFPSITLKYIPKTRRLICRKNDNEYGPTRLSDGEKQVFSILVDIVELTDSESVLFVDEPELNLNPGLANRLWGSIEALLPNAIFLYATHSVSFAMRDTIDRLIVLSNENSAIQELGGLNELSHTEREDLLGNIPSLLSQKRNLVVEGHDTSFDSILYKWLLSDIEFATSSVGGSNDVIAITQREGKWQKISPAVQLTGVVDADYKSDSQIASVQGSNLIVLGLHEAESYLCEPTLLSELAESLGTAPSSLKPEDIEDHIIQFLKDNSLAICSRRTNEKLALSLRPSIPSKALAKITSFDDLETLFLSSVKEQMSKAVDSFDEINVKKLLAEEKSGIETAINDRDIYTVLKLAPGKELLDSLVPRIGVADANTVARSARKHLDWNKYEFLKELSALLKVAVS